MTQQLRHEAWLVLAVLLAIAFLAACFPWRATTLPSRIETPAPEESLTLEKNPYYWNADNTEIDSLEFRILR